MAAAFRSRPLSASSARRKSGTSWRLRLLQLLIFFVIIVVGVWCVNGLYPVAPGDAKPVALVIEPGSSVSEISQKLQEKSLIRSSLMFKLFVQYKDLGSALKAGTYTFNRGQSLPEIVEALVQGKSADIVVTIPEGMTVADIDALLVSYGLGKAGDFIACAKSCDFSDVDFLPPATGGSSSPSIGTRLEGYVFPDTYYVSVAGYEPRVFIQRMLETFRLRIISEYGDDIKSSGRTLAQLLIMASLVQEESRGNADERAMVAGILWKRLDSGVALGVDATVRYALQKPKLPLSRSDLAIDSPYNTRKHAGLPPTPIASPGEDAFNAAVHPKNNEYWYYLHDAEGVIHYAKTNDEHNENRARYLR